MLLFQCLLSYGLLLIILCVYYAELSLTNAQAVKNNEYFSNEGQKLSEQNQWQSFPLKWAVVYDARQVSITDNEFENILRRFINITFDVNGKELFVQSPTLINSHGDVVTALTLITSLMLSGANAYIPDVLFLMESADVSTEVTNLLKKSSLTRELVIVSALTSNNEVCDINLNPHTICVPPRDVMNTRAVLEVGAAQLNWRSIAIIYENSDYGRGVRSSISDVLQEAVNIPTIVHETFMSVETTSQEEDKLVQSVLVEKPHAIVCFVNALQFTRLRDAFARVTISEKKLGGAVVANDVSYINNSSSSSNTVFLLGSKETVEVLPNLTFKADAMYWWGGLFLPNYTSIASFAKLGIATSVAEGQMSSVVWDDYLAMSLSFLFDGMSMVAQANGTASLTALHSVNFSGFTGPVAFDPIYHQRIPCVFSLVTENYQISEPLLTWSLKSYYDLPQINVYNDDHKKAIQKHIVASPLLSVTVCMTSPSTCADVQMLSAMLYRLLTYNNELSEQVKVENNNNNSSNASTRVSMRPIAINTGESGVSGLSNLIPIARSCTFVTGPGRSNVALALTPVINEYGLTQIDYNSGSDFFTTQPGSYPLFVRTTPSDSFKFASYGEVCDHFAWERVIIISTKDQIGASRAQSLATAMLHHNIHVEQTYMLDNSSESAFRSVFNTIYARDVSRIIFVEAASVSSKEAGAFYNLSDSLPFMHNYVFFLSVDLCLFGYMYPSARAKLQSSICIYSYIEEDKLHRVNAQLQQRPELHTKLQTILSDGGFVAEAQMCNLTVIQPFAGFAMDAGDVIIDAVYNALHDNVSLSTSSNLLPYVRNHTFTGLTGKLSIDNNGNRKDAAFTVDIQIPHEVLVIGIWNDLRVPKFQVMYTTPFVWMTNKTDVPLDTFRDISFVISNTLTASPGAIVLSVLGFIGTITIFFFWYRHYKMQKLIELTLEGNEIPVTEEELQRLRGDYKFND